MSGFVFTPLDSRSPDFPRVSAAEQVARDAEAERIVRAELETVDADNPQAQAALEREYELRFKKPAPGWKFTPLEGDSGEADAGGGFKFTPIETEQPSTLRNVALNNPLTAAGEAAANLGSQMVALPAAGLAGLATEAGRALGITDRSGADVVHAVGDRLTYIPRGEMGRAAAEAVMWPFEKLHEGAEWAGGKTIEAGGSPGAATAVHTAIEGVLPLVVAPGVKAGKAGVVKVRERVAAERPPAAEAGEFRFTPLEEVADAAPAANPVAGAAQTGPAIPRDIRQAETGAAGDLASPAQRGFATPVQAAAEAAVADIRQRAQMAMERIDERNGSPAGHLESDSSPLPAPEQQGLPLLRRQGDQDGAGVGSEFPAISRGRGAEAEPGALAWAPEHQRPLRAGERGMDVAEDPGHTLPEMPVRPGERSAADGGGSRATGRLAKRDAEAPLESGLAAVRSADADAVPHWPAEKTARWALVEADDLKASHDVDMRPVAENPFGKQGATRHENEMAVQGITRDPRPERLAEALDDAEGAPVVARDGVVEAGQRRTIAIQRIYQANGQKAHEYRTFLRQNAARFGLAPEQAGAMKKPVLVRLPDQEAPRRAAGTDFPPEKAAAVQDMAAGVQNGTWNPGANYTPFVDQARAPVSKATSVADLPAPIRRERILKRFADALGTTVYQGRMKGEKRLGFFRRGVEEVRIRKANDIEVAAHELGHLLDARVPKIANAWRTDKALREELKSISYDQKKVSEGYAEGVRLFLTQPETLQARAPRVFQWLDDFANTHEHGPALKKAQADMVSWFEQDALNRARSKIGDPNKFGNGPVMQYLGDWWREQRGQFRQAIIDDLDGVYRMERELKGGRIDPAGPYESARLSRASASIADGAVRWGHPVKNPDGSFKFAGKGLEEILKPVVENLNDALLYFVGRSARELQAQGREHLFTAGEVDAMLKLRTPEREAAFREYQTWNRGILDFAEAQSVISPESRRMWQRTQYLPFHRVGQAGGFKGKPGDWSGIKALTGGTENIRDVLGNMVGNAAQLIDKAVKNEARLKVAELAEKTPGAGRFMVKIDAETRPVKIDTQQVIDGLLKALGIDRSGYTARGEKLPKYVQKIIDGLEADLAKSPGFEFVIGGQPPAGRNVVAVLKGGKPTWYEVGDPILYRSLLAIDRPVQGWLVRLLGLPKRIGQASITLTPDFWIANIARDTLMGSVMTRSGFRPIIDSLQGMRLRLTSDPVYKDYIANGGGLSSIYLDEAALRTKLEKFYARQGIDHRTVLDAPGKLLHFIETVGDAFEMSTRLGEYRKAIARGEHPRHAAYLGREVSTDFAMMGDAPAAQFMYNTVMFLRPAVVSIDRLVRGVAHDPNKGAIAAKTAAIALTSVGLYLLNRDDPRYADLPDWDRDANWHFFIGDQHFRWPKIWEIGALASVAERSAEKLMAEDPEGLGKDFARIVGQTFNLNLMPQILAPLYEQATNRNSFTKAPIETPGMEGVQPFLRAKPGTSETMKAAGMATRDLPEALQVNPARAEALLRGYLNTWGMYGLMLTDQAFFGDRLPEKRADELPVVRRFYSQEPSRHTKFESQFYEMLTEAKRLRGTLKELDEMNLRGYADEKERSPLAGEAKPLERAAKNLGAIINKEMEFVRRDQNLTPAEKRQRLDALTLERNALLKEAVLESKKAQKEKTQ